MIKANELRIGNRVYGGDPARSIAEILTIVQEGVEAKYWLIGANSSSDNPSNALAESNNTGIGFAKFEDIYPIPLTPDILVKCGFKMMPIGKYADWGNWHLDSSQHLVSFDDRTDTKGFSYNGCSLWHPTIYLHQLQNLYFVLTGQELTIKL